MNKVRHVLGISGGKDSAALAIYMHNNYPELEIEYYTADTGKELEETYTLLKNLEVFLGKQIIKLSAEEDATKAFDNILKGYNGYLPSTNARWCTKKLKLEPFEKFVGDDPVISYVGIRGDEDREGYISKKSNIQSIFPFRRNIWSEDVILKVLAKDNRTKLLSILEKHDFGEKQERFAELLQQPVTGAFPVPKKLNRLLDLGIKESNHIIFDFLKETEYPLSKEINFPLLNDENVLIKADIFKLLEDSGVGVPGYYREIDFEVNHKKGTYSRSRSGCYFCFYQQKIEWVWLYEQHPDLFKEAMKYEKEGYTWIQDESLTELSKPERIIKIKEEYLKRKERNALKSSSRLCDILDDSESEGCASCFI